MGDTRRVQHGFYCSSCGALYATLGSGLITCQRCGAIGLRGFRKRPMRVSCAVAGCSFTGWDDGGINNDLPQHLRLAHKPENADG